MILSLPFRAVTSILRFCYFSFNFETNIMHLKLFSRTFHKQFHHTPFLHQNKTYPCRQHSCELANRIPPVIIWICLLLWPISRRLSLESVRPLARFINKSIKRIILSNRQLNQVCSTSRRLSSEPWDLSFLFPLQICFVRNEPLPVLLTFYPEQCFPWFKQWSLQLFSSSNF